MRPESLIADPHVEMAVAEIDLQSIGIATESVVGVGPQDTWIGRSARMFGGTEESAWMCRETERRPVAAVGLVDSGERDHHPSAAWHRESPEVTLHRNVMGGKQIAVRQGGTRGAVRGTLHGPNTACDAVT